MGNFLKTQNVFSRGEISSDFYALNNNNAVAKLENIDVLQSGGLKRRKGLKKIAIVPYKSILVPFQISENEKYLLVIYRGGMDIYQNDVKIENVVSPWGENDLDKIQYVQRFNSIFFVHPDYQPRILTKDENGFKMSYFNFYLNSDMSMNIPFKRFDDTEGVTFTMSASSLDNNHALFTANVDFWDKQFVGQRFLINDKQWILTSIQNNRVAELYTNKDFSIVTTPITQWYEEEFNEKRGWPACICFHQNRLVFGCTASAPNNIWMSKVGDYTNFDVGTGLDDEAIFLTLLSAQHHQICNIVSSDKLQILTSVGEWAISSSPLSPSNVDIKQHTSVGSVSKLVLPPQQIEGATVFISESGTDIRELDLDDLGENYNATDLCVASKHLMKQPISVAYNQHTHQFFVVMRAGNMAVLNKYINTDISAWANYKTDGEIQYVGVLDNETYVVVKRDDVLYLEKFDEDYLSDSDNYDFSYTVSALPMITNGHTPRKIRARKISLRVKDTKSVFINGYRCEIPNDVYENGHIGYSGDLSMNLLGTQRDTMQPLWTISSNEQLPATILSVTVDGWYQV